MIKDYASLRVEVLKRKQKNMYLRVKRDGRVVVTCPTSMSDARIEEFVRSRLDWINKERARQAVQPSLKGHSYETGDVLHLWGESYELEFVSSSRNNLEFFGSKAILKMRASSSLKQRERFVREEYRKILCAEIELFLPKWERITGLYADSWQTKYMTSRWGTCNTKDRRIWLNLQLVQKPKACLEYVILHELVHLRVPSHNADFHANMTYYMPDWKQRRKLLNN